MAKRQTRAEKNVAAYRRRLQAIVAGKAAFSVRERDSVLAAVMLDVLSLDEWVEHFCEGTSVPARRAKRPKQ